jgi:hypothetical protein
LHLIPWRLTISPKLLDELKHFVAGHFIETVFFFALGALVMVTARLARPKRREIATDYPPPFGMSVILWVVVGLFGMLMLAAADVGWTWFGAGLSLGPLIMFANWPMTISVDDIYIQQHAWCRRRITMFWTDITSVALTKNGDAVLLTDHYGQKIKISDVQVGVDQLLAEVSRRTKKPVPPWDPVVQRKLF